MNGRHSAVARPLRGKEFDPTNCRNYMLMVQNRQPKRGAKLRRDPKRSALLWLLKRVILGENVKGVEIRLHSWREEERERVQHFFNHSRWSGHGTREGRKLGYLFFSFPLFLHAFLTLEDLKCAIKSLFCPGTWSAD